MNEVNRRVNKADGHNYNLHLIKETSFGKQEGKDLISYR